MRASGLAAAGREALARLVLRRCARVGAEPRVLGRLWVHGDGEIVIGDRVVLDASTAPIEIYPRAGAVIVIGDDVTIESGASIDATRSIRVGSRCRVGAFCKLMDNHFHPLTGDRGAQPEATPVVVEDDVALGPHVVLLAGAHVSRGSQVGARSVVKRRTPPGAVLRGGVVVARRDLAR